MRLPFVLGGITAVAVSVVHAGDPSPGWLSYADYRDANKGQITQFNASWTVPAKPKKLTGSNAPGWWFGIQTDDGNGALVQPILAWGYEGNVWSIFNGVYDWTDQSWNTSPETYTVQPGDKIVSSISLSDASQRAYTMRIKSITEPTKEIAWTYYLKTRQHQNESWAMFVLEHQPDSCAAYPADGKCSFQDIYLEVDYQPVKPTWVARQETPACDSKATVVSPSQIDFTWSASASSNSTRTEVRSERGLYPRKWGFGRNATRDV